MPPPPQTVLQWGQCLSKLHLLFLSLGLTRLVSLSPSQGYAHFLALEVMGPAGK